LLKPVQVAKPAPAAPTIKPIEKKRTAADFAWSPPKLVNMWLKLRYDDGRRDEWNVMMPEKPTTEELEKKFRELSGWQGELAHLESDVKLSHYKFRAGHPPPDTVLYASTGLWPEAAPIVVALDFMSTLGSLDWMKIRPGLKEDEFLTCAERKIWPRGSRQRLRCKEKFVPPTDKHIYVLEPY
jgi:hypothetical protein